MGQAGRGYTSLLLLIHWLELSHLVTREAVPLRNGKHFGGQLSTV